MPMFKLVSDSAYVPMPPLLGSLLPAAIFLVLFALRRFTRRRPVYLVDFACYKPSDERKCSRDKFMYHSSLCGAFTAESLDFQRRVLDRSGIGDESYVPRSLTSIPMRKTLAEARLETEEVMFGAVEQLLSSTKVPPRSIGILIVNCSLFNPTPSLASTLVNHFGLRSNIASFNLAGMGCSASLISVDLAADLLRSRESTYALVVSTENITLNWFLGNDRSMLVTNCLFRMGGAAILLSSRRRDSKVAKYELVHTVRTHLGAQDKAFHCVSQREEEGLVGVALSKDLMVVAGEALRSNLTTLAPMVLPVSEKARYAAWVVARWLARWRRCGRSKGSGLRYVPDFRTAAEHFCVHAGGRGVLDEVQKHLGLGDRDLEPSRTTLFKWGNTSSSSIWYELAYCEATGRVHRGHRVLQLAFGSGFKCNSAVWRARRTVDACDNVWSDFLRGRSD